MRVKQRQDKVWRQRKTNREIVKTEKLKERMTVETNKLRN